MEDDKFRQKLLRLCGISDLTTNLSFFAHFCRSEQDFEEAFRLLYRAYLEKGLIFPNEQEAFFTPFQLLEDSRTVIVRSAKENRAVCTATLVIDSEKGLPSDCAYKDKIDQLRRKKKTLAEYTCLAAERDGSDVFARSAPLFHAFRLLFLYAREKRVSDVVISVRLNHAPFYEKILFFEPIGEVRVYPNLRNAVAVLERLDLTKVEEKFREAYLGFEEGRAFYDFFFGPLSRHDREELNSALKPPFFVDPASFSSLQHRSLELF